MRATHLQDWKFERIGELRELRRRDIPDQPGLYAFVALEEVIESERFVFGGVSGEVKDGWMVPEEGGERLLQASELFYIGATDATHRLRSRLPPYCHFVNCEHPKVIPYAKYDAMPRVRQVLRKTCLQRVPVDVYIRPIEEGIIHAREDMPMHVIRGMETALIQMCDPIGNIKHKPLS